MDGTVSTMTARVASDGQAHTPPAHQRLVCETDVSGATHVRIGSVPLKVPPDGFAPSAMVIGPL